MEKVALQQLPAGEVLITVAGTAVSDLLPLPAAYALVVQGNFRCGVSGVSPWPMRYLIPLCKPRAERRSWDSIQATSNCACCMYLPCAAVRSTTRMRFPPPSCLRRLQVSVREQGASANGQAMEQTSIAAAVGTCLTWNVPSAVVTSGPSGLTNSSTAAFTFAARDGSPGGQQNCSWIGGLGAMQGTPSFAAWFACGLLALPLAGSQKRPTLHGPWPAGAGYNCTLRKLVMPSQLQPVEWNQTSCSGTANYTGLTDGSYEFRVWVRALACNQLWRAHRLCVHAACRLSLRASGPPVP